MPQSSKSRVVVRGAGHTRSIDTDAHRKISPPGSGLFYLSAHLIELFPDKRIDFKHEIFKDLIRLDVIDIIEDIMWERENNLCYLKRLRYLSFVEFYDGEVMAWLALFLNILKECKGLTALGVCDVSRPDDLLVLLEDGLKGFKVVQETGDKIPGYLVPECRLVINPRGGSGNWVGDWVNVVEGRESLWTAAEDIVLERKRTIEVGSYNSPPPK
ncbi:hypothetical protein AX16_001293 [Volvariella volvacea WC 439]|nr:hypothetical protein AX16_001293 [Volvariella volvacea WC 439]